MISSINFSNVSFFFSLKAKEVLLNWADKLADSLVYLETSFEVLWDVLVDKRWDSGTNADVLALVDAEAEIISLLSWLAETLSCEICDPTSDNDPDIEPDTDNDTDSLLEALPLLVPSCPSAVVVTFPWPNVAKPLKASSNCLPTPSTLLSTFVPTEFWSDTTVSSSPSVDGASCATLGWSAALIATGAAE